MIGADGIALIKSFESCARRRPDGRFEAYMPTPDDVPTIGWGSTGPDIRLGLVFTQDECDQRFARDIGQFCAKVAAMLTEPPRPHQFDAMVSLAYNIGPTAFRGSSVLRRHNGRDFAGAAAAFHMWNKQKGKVLAGLVRRRNAEARLYLN